MNYFINSLKKYAVFKGRASRREYWMFNFYYIIFYFILMIFAPNSFSPEILYAYILVMLMPMYSAAARRLHDTNHSALWLFTSFIPVLNIVMLIFLIMGSNPGNNKYGLNPNVAITD